MDRQRKRAAVENGRLNWGWKQAGSEVRKRVRGRCVRSERFRSEWVWSERFRREWAKNHARANSWNRRLKQSHVSVWPRLFSLRVARFWATERSGSVQKNFEAGAHSYRERRRFTSIDGSSIISVRWPHTPANSPACAFGSSYAHRSRIHQSRSRWKFILACCFNLKFPP